MPTETTELVVFHAIVKHGSYTKAAEEMSLTPSGVSRIISRLEERLGVRLVQRTTRKLSLTEAGASFHAHTAHILADLADAEAEVQQATVQPRGTLRVSASVVFGRLYLTSMLDALLQRFPDLSFDISLTNRFVDLVEEGVDLALRIGALADSRLIARRLCSNRRVLVASPDYLRKSGTPRSPDDLSRHECVLYTGFPRPRQWKLLGPGGAVTVNVSGRVASNNVEVLTESARHGVGITVAATLSVVSALLSGELVRVLSDHEFEPSAVFAVYPSARQLSTKVRSVVDFLVETLQDPPHWDRRLQGNVPGFG